MSSLFLIGYRGTGKSTVGRQVAATLGWPFVDADQRIQEKSGRTIREIFARQGEGAFRELECEVVAELARLNQTVVALGGGAVLRAENRAMLEPHVVAWLRADAETLHRRIEADAASRAQRPNLTRQGGIDEIRTVLAERTPIYDECADFTVETIGLTPDQVANEVVSLGSKYWTRTE